MIYLKFVGKKEDGLIERMICVNDFSVVRDDVGARIYFDKSQWERVSPKDWLNCFVVSDAGKTIGRYSADSL